jgi:hypothetical protein
MVRSPRLVWNPPESSRYAGKCLTAASNTDGAIVTIQTCTGATSQKWTFTGGSVKIFDNTKCLDVTGGSTTNGNTLQIWTCSTNNNPNQQFYYTVRSLARSTWWATQFF